MDSTYLVNFWEDATSLPVSAWEQQYVTPSPPSKEQEEIHIPHHVSNSLAAGLSAGVTCALYNPLDCLRIRWQTTSLNTLRSMAMANGGSGSGSSGLYEFGTTIIRQEGLANGLWKPGLVPNVMGMGLSSAIRFGWYEIVRDGISGITPQSGSVPEKQLSSMILAGLICGSLGYAASAPFHLLKTITQAQKTLVIEANAGVHPFSHANSSSSLNTFMTIVRNGGVLGLWNGVVPLTCRGALFTTGQMVGYDGVKTILKKEGCEEGPLLHIVSSFAASFGASFLSAPADLVMTKFMTANACQGHTSSSPSSRIGLYSCTVEIVTRNGILGLWRGWSLFFIRLTPVMLTYSILYEQFRHVLGIGYFS